MRQSQRYKSNKLKTTLQIIVNITIVNINNVRINIVITPQLPRVMILYHPKLLRVVVPGGVFSPIFSASPPPKKTFNF